MRFRRKRWAAARGWLAGGRGRPAEVSLPPPSAPLSSQHAAEDEGRQDQEPEPLGVLEPGETVARLVGPPARVLPQGVEKRRAERQEEERVEPGEETGRGDQRARARVAPGDERLARRAQPRTEEHTSELQSL